MTDLTFAKDSKEMNFAKDVARFIKGRNIEVSEENIDALMPHILKAYMNVQLQVTEVLLSNPEETANDVFEMASELVK